MPVSSFVAVCLATAVLLGVGLAWVSAKPGWSFAAAGLATAMLLGVGLA